MFENHSFNRFYFVLQVSLLNIELLHVYKIYTYRDVLLTFQPHELCLLCELYCCTARLSVLRPVWRQLWLQGEIPLQVSLATQVIRFLVFLVNVLKKRGIHVFPFNVKGLRRRLGQNYLCNATLVTSACCIKCHCWFQYPLPYPWP